MSEFFKQDHSLKAHNTFGVAVKARIYGVLEDEDQFSHILDETDEKPMILGGGSNLLLTRDIDIPVIQNGIRGIEIIDTHENITTVRVGGGVVWHNLVLWAVENGLGGLENLALIPGSVGASPIQNIGAYGAELKHVFQQLEAIDLTTGELFKFNKSDCQFGYRDSVFKRALKGQLCISRVLLTLTNANHNINTDYGAIGHTLHSRGIHNPTIKDVCDAVISIRSSKLPDPAELGNSGSFFKNPIIPIDQKDQLLNDRPDLVWYPVDAETVKIPAGWLIDKAGWKGVRHGDVGCYDKQALVIVNFGGATGKEILDFAMEVQASVEREFGIILTPEVNII